MGYLKTVLTYRVPAEAEVDQSLLEANGITVHLLNDRSPPGDVLFPLPIELQVPGEQYEKAVDVLREFNPGRFGSPERARQIELELRRTVGRFIVGGGAAAAATWLVITLVAPPGSINWQVSGPVAAFFAGGFASLRWFRNRSG